MAPDNYYSQIPKEILKVLGSSPNGISSSLAEKRLKEQGPNILVKEVKFKTFKILLDQFKNYFILLLLFASFLSFRFESAANGTVLAAVVALNVLVSFIQERKAENTIERLRKLSPSKVAVLRNGRELQVPAADLVVGDVVILREGESVPADLQLFEVGDLKIDQAVLTGESTPAEKSIEPSLPETSLADRRNVAYVGTLVVSGNGKGVVVKTGAETEFAQIAAFVQEQEERSLLLERISRLGIWLTSFSGFLAVLILVLSVWRGDSLAHAVNFAIATFVSAVPESLPTTTTLALALTALRLSRKKALVRHLPVTESLAGINVFAFDKTGTLTLNEMSVARILLPGERRLEITGTGFGSEGEAQEKGKRVNPEEDVNFREFVRIAAHSSAANILPAGEEGKQHWVVRGDPTEGAFLILAEKVGIKVESSADLKDDLAFTSDRRMRTRIFSWGGELTSCSLGSPEEILSRAHFYSKGQKILKLTPSQKEKFSGEAQRLAQQGYRVLAIATKRWKGGDISTKTAEKELVFLGVAGLLDQPKEGVTETFRDLRQAGVNPIIITGDHPGTALAVARNIDLVKSEREVLTGEQLDTISDQELKQIYPQIKVYARISPKQKYRLVQVFKEMGLRVAVSGDGVNDAPALKKADVGVVMGKKGTDVSKEAADLVILDDNLGTILPAIKEARTLYDNIKKFFTFLISGNFVELLIIVAALGMGLPQPLTTLQILWINLVTDALPAFALVYDPPRTHAMESGPRDLGPGMVKPVLQYAFFLGFVALVGESVLFLRYLSDIDLARTILFTSAVVFELVIVFSIRTSSPFWKVAFTNRYLLAAFVFSFGLQALAIYFPPLSGVMGTVGLEGQHWLAIFAFVVGSFGVTEIFKSLARRRNWTLFGPPVRS